MWTLSRHNAETLRQHMLDDAAAFAAIEHRAAERDRTNRADADAWRSGLGQRLDQQDAAMSGLKSILLRTVGGAVVIGISVIGWLLAPLLHGAVGK